MFSYLIFSMLMHGPLVSGSDSKDPKKGSYVGITEPVLQVSAVVHGTRDYNDYWNANEFFKSGEEVFRYLYNAGSCDFSPDLVKWPSPEEVIERDIFVDSSPVCMFVGLPKLDNIKNIGCHLRRIQDDNLDMARIYSKDRSGRELIVYGRGGERDGDVGRIYEYKCEGPRTGHFVVFGAHYTKEERGSSTPNIGIAYLLDIQIHEGKLFLRKGSSEGTLFYHFETN